MSGTALATFSIVAVDLRDGSVGGAVASCVGIDTTYQVYGAVPGHGAIITQSYLHPEAQAYGLAWLGAGESPDTILQTLTDPSYDSDFELRQYALVSAAGDIASFTGSGANPYAGHLTFEVRDSERDERRFVVSAQGNFLTGQEVLERAKSGFQTEACDLPERLLNALTAAGSAGGGDARCTPSGTPAESALLATDPPAFPQGTYLKLATQVDAPSTQDPLPALKIQFEGWRGVHPCPAQESGAGGSGGESSEASLEAKQDGCRVAGQRSGSGRLDVALWLALATLGGWLRRRYTAPHPQPLGGPDQL